MLSFVPYAGLLCCYCARHTSSTQGLSYYDLRLPSRVEHIFLGPSTPSSIGRGRCCQQVCFTVDVVLAVRSLVSLMYFLSMQP